MKVVVFGASGFVGINVVKAFQNAGISVLASDIRNSPYLSGPFIPADLLEYDQVSAVIKGTDIVVHLAASPLPVSIEKPCLNARINIEGSLNIMDAAREHGVRKVIFSSASSLIGEVQYNPVDENHPAKPKTPYGVAKYAIEHYLRVYQELYGLDYLVFRFFNIYGPWQYPESGALIPMVYRKLKDEGKFTVNGDGSQSRDFIYIGDLAEFYVKAVLGDMKNEVVNLGTGKGTTIKEVVEIAGEILGIKPEFVYQPKRLGEIDNFVADTKKLEKMFGEKPETSIRDGLIKTFNWFSGQ